MSDSPARIRDRLRDLVADAIGRTYPRLTPRRIAAPVHLPGKATAVIGMRRAGKTTFLHQILEERVESGTPREQLVSLSFEDEQLVGVRGEDLHHLVDAYHRRFPDAGDGAPVTWFFDEIQVVPGWERFVRRLLDGGNVEIFLSGSSATLLSREIATSMRGRAWEVLVHPFSFRETLDHHGIPVGDPRLRSLQDRLRLDAALRRYLTVGGFPEAQPLESRDRHQLLTDYVDMAMLRDVVERHGVTNVVALRWLIRHLLGNAAGLFSVEKFFKALKSQGIRVSKDTVHGLLAHLQDCFLVRTVWIESESERRRFINPRKAYPVDPGLIPVFDRTDRTNLGHALETVILLEAERRRLEVTYVKTTSGFVVDFLFREPGGGAELVQVCADPSDGGTLGRELRSLEEAGREFPGAMRRLLTLEPTGAEVPGVEIQPAYEWLLGMDTDG